MEKEFIPYELALRMKKLGFNEPCFGSYRAGSHQLDIIESGNILSNFTIFAPLYQQAFRFFRVKYSICVEIHETTDWEEDNESWSFVIFKYRLGDNDGMISSTIDYDTYEDAELDCLKKLIEIVK
jgi:hypothetical protein